MRLGSLAVKRVLGKDETAGSNPASGFLPLDFGRFSLLCVSAMTRTQGRDLGVKTGIPTTYSDYSELNGSLHKAFKNLLRTSLDQDRRIR